MKQLTTDQLEQCAKAAAVSWLEHDEWLHYSPESKRAWLKVASAVIAEYERQRETEKEQLGHPLMPQPGDYPEDFPDDNGNYGHVCPRCQKPFTGHKRRQSCKVCTSTPTPPPGYHPATPEERLKLPEGYMFLSLANNRWEPGLYMGDEASSVLNYACPDLPTDGELVTHAELSGWWSVNPNMTNLARRLNATYRGKLASLRESLDAWVKAARDIADERDDLQSRLAALESERENWRLPSSCRQMRAEITSLESRLAAAEKDAAHHKLMADALEQAERAQKLHVVELQAELAQLQWRGMDVKPTKEDALHGYVLVVGNNEQIGLWRVCDWDSMAKYGGCFYKWLPLSYALPPKPDPEAEMRAEFEAWAKSQGYICNRAASGNYTYDSTDDAWTGWQAARATKEDTTP